MNKKTIKITSLIIVVIIIASATYFGYRKVEGSKAQTKNAIIEMQNKLDEQQAKVDELQGFKADQDRVNAEANAQETEVKKADCESRLKKWQDSLVSSQGRLKEFQVVLKYVENDDCPREKTKLVDTVCYDDCLRESDCDKSSCDDSIKKECKKSHEENISNMKEEMADISYSLKRSEVNVQNIKNECSQYLN